VLIGGEEFGTIDFPTLLDLTTCCDAARALFRTNDSAVVDMVAVVDTLPIVSEVSATATRVRSALLGVYRAVAVGFFASCALLESILTMPFIARSRRFHARARWLHRWSRFAARVMCIQITTHGSVPRSGLVASNHLSYLDIIVFSSVRPCVFVAKRDVAYWPFWGWLARAGGTIFVNRRSRLDAARATAAMNDAIQAGLLLVLFPEGTSSNGATVLPFRSPLLEPVVQLQCQITAANIDYSLPQGSVANEVYYWGDMTLLPHMLNVFTKPEIHSQLSFADFQGEVANRKQIARDLHAAVLRLRSLKT
jgi:lyso-ornithine lipid O-acyltransferase